MDDLHAADVIFVATHSQGSIVSAHLLARLLDEGHIVTQKSMDIVTKAAALVAPGGASPSQSARAHTQRICCLALCGIHLGPLRYLRTSSLLQPYIQVSQNLSCCDLHIDRWQPAQYFENQAARELFDFQNTESEVSRKYVKALNTVMDHGVRAEPLTLLSVRLTRRYDHRRRWCTSRHSTTRSFPSTRASLRPRRILGSCEHCTSTATRIRECVLVT